MAISAQFRPAVPEAPPTVTTRNTTKHGPEPKAVTRNVTARPEVGITRPEFDALKAEVAALRSQIEMLSAKPSAECAKDRAAYMREYRKRKNAALTRGVAILS